VHTESEKSQLRIMDFLPSLSTENDAPLDIWRSYPSIATQHWPTPEDTISTKLEQRQCYIDQMEAGGKEELRSLVITCLNDDPANH